MKKTTRFLIFLSYLFGSISLITYSFIFLFGSNWLNIVSDWVFFILIIFYLLSIEEFYRWVKNGYRSEMSDLVAILFFFFLIFFASKDILTSIMGSFSIYLWFGVYELREYPVLNKILIISLTTYNVIFISGLVSTYLGNPIVLNTAFAFSFWIILGLGFLLFGRKYLVIWRFMSPEYLTLFLYIIAWLAVAFIDEYTPINFIDQKALLFSEFSFTEIFLNIYFILILVNWIIYFISGPILDSMLGIKSIKDIELLKIVDDVKNDVGIKGKVKAGFGTYPIINAMAYGSFLDKRIAIIAEDINNLPRDEIKGIIAHELSHTKGKHTLILTLITSADLVFRMLLGIPATFYDYTFGNPQIPLLGFIILNIGIYIILFIFVRILEGKADLKTKKIGYSKELIKALYNLESFYATGREIGLNTMLLCDERITEYNKIINYIDTADYLNKSIIKPSRLSLLSNLLNSHPPTYYRIAAVLDNELKPTKEALLPFICLKNSKRNKYASVFEKSRLEFKTIATNKFKELFQIENISDFLFKIKRKELYQLDIGKQFLFKNKIDRTFNLGQILDIKFQNDVCDKDIYIINNSANNEQIELNASFFEKTWISLHDQYYFEKEGILKLINVEFNSNNTEGNLVFLDLHQNKVIKNLAKIKMPNPISLLEDLENTDVFLKLKGSIRIYSCETVKILNDFKESCLRLREKSTSGEKENFTFKLKDLIIKPREIYFQIRKTKLSRNEELSLIDWIKSKQLRAYYHLKKPVNNMEIGYIDELNLIFKATNNKSQDELIEKESFLIIRNIFKKIVKIPYNELELISFEYKTVSIQMKAETSYFSKLGYKLLKRFKPQRIFYL